MPDEIVELSEFPDEASAWLARAVLESNGIPSQVITDPSLRWMSLEAPRPW